MALLLILLRGRRIERRLSYPLAIRLLAASNAFHETKESS